MKWIISIVLFAASTALGQQPETCPVEITRVTNIFHRVEIEFRNTSDKEISGAAFQLFRQGPVDDVALIYPDISGEEKLQPNKKTTSKWDDRGILWMQDYGNRNNGLGVYATRIKFADGTLWQDNGSRTCNRVHKTK